MKLICLNCSSVYDIKPGKGLGWPAAPFCLWCKGVVLSFYIKKRVRREEDAAEDKIVGDDKP